MKVRPVAWLSHDLHAQVATAAMVSILFWAAALQLDHLLTQPRIDLAFSGAVLGRMTELQSSPTCSTERVYGSDEWTGNFDGSVNGQELQVVVAIYPYRGAGKYVSAGIPDAATLKSSSLTQAFGTIQLHILVSERAVDKRNVHSWGTEPDPAHRPTSADQLATLAGLGHRSRLIRTFGRVESKRYSWIRSRRAPLERT